jgi:hypothetical protein
MDSEFSGRSRGFREFKRLLDEDAAWEVAAQVWMDRRMLNAKQASEFSRVRKERAGWKSESYGDKSGKLPAT